MSQAFVPALRDFLAAPGPFLVVVAGPNGAGKSTFFEQFLRTTGVDFVNADVIERQLAHDSEASDPYAAARMAEALRRDLVRRRRSFCMETVLSDPVGDKVQWLRTVQASGYRILMIGIRLSTTELSIARVRHRVAQGGHDVPRDKLQSRFDRSARNVADALKFADLALMFDNSSLSAPFQLVEVLRRGEPLPTLDA